MNFPDIPSRLRNTLDPAFYSWFTELKTFITSYFQSFGDVTMSTAGKGVVLTNATGTVTKRVRLNNAGDGLIFEDVT
jgi:hypothetical protein